MLPQAGAGGELNQSFTPHTDHKAAPFLRSHAAKGGKNAQENHLCGFVVQFLRATCARCGLYRVRLMGDD